MSRRIIVLVDGVWKVAYRIGEGEKQGTVIYELNGRRGIAKQYTWAPVSDRLNDRGAEEMAIKYNIESIQPKVTEPPRRNRNVDIEDEWVYVPGEDGNCNCAFCREMRGQ